MKLDIDQPIELGEFVGAFTALASEYDRFIRVERPAEAADATLYVKEVRAGCIEADLIAWGLKTLMLGGGAVLAGAAAFNTLDEFVERLGKRILEALYDEGMRNRKAAAAEPEPEPETGTA